jgi:hypothetical protein
MVLVEVPVVTFDEIMACRRLPAPLSFMFVTLKIVRSCRPSRLSISGRRRACDRRVLRRSLGLLNIENVNMGIVSGFRGIASGRRGRPTPEPHARLQAKLVLLTDIVTAGSDVSLAE